MGSSIQISSLEELDVLVFQSIDCKGAIEIGKLINLMARYSQKILSKDIESRWRVVESNLYTIDLNMDYFHANSNVITREWVVGKFIDRKNKSSDDLL